MKKILIDKNWKMRRTDEERFYGASVPGSVYRDLLSAGQMEDPFPRHGRVRVGTDIPQTL